MKQALYGLFQLFLFFVSYFPIQSVRVVIYRAFGAKIGKGVSIQRGVEIFLPHKLTIGNNTIIGARTILDTRRGLTIGANVNIASDVAIFTLQHIVNDVDFGVEGGPVNIGDRAWVSYRSTILPSISIGEGAVLAAGAVVTKDVPSYTIVGGVPAKHIGERNKDILYELTGFIPFV